MILRGKGGERACFAASANIRNFSDGTITSYPSTHFTRQIARLEVGFSPKIK